jgi:hypothetical protein
MTEQGREPPEEELRAAYEAELKRIRVEDVILQTVVSLINLGGRKAGLAPGAEDERDLDQVRQAIEAVRVLLPQVEGLLGPDAAQIRDALSQLQLAYARFGGASAPAGAPDAPGGPQPDAGPEAEKGPGGPPPGGETPDQAGGAGPAQSSGRLWVPGR